MQCLDNIRGPIIQSQNSNDLKSTQSSDQIEALTLEKNGQQVKKANLDKNAKKINSNVKKIFIILGCLLLGTLIGSAIGVGVGGALGSLFGVGMILLTPSAMLTSVTLGEVFGVCAGFAAAGIGGLGTIIGGIFGTVIGYMQAKGEKVLEGAPIKAGPIALAAVNVSLITLNGGHPI